MASQQQNFPNGLTVSPDNNAGVTNFAVNSSGNVAANGTLQVTGATALAGALAVTGALTAASTVQFGTLVSSTGTGGANLTTSPSSITGYITITDAGGTSRKIAVVV